MTRDDAGTAGRSTRQGRQTSGSPGATRTPDTRFRKGYVIALRRFLLKAVKAFQKGIEPPGLAFDSFQNEFAGSTLLGMVRHSHAGLGAG